MSVFRMAFGFVVALPLLHAADEPAVQYEKEIRPALVRLCGECHNKDKDVPFLKALKFEDMNASRWAWRSAVSQLRNRTMPPADEDQPTEAERIHLSAWIEKTLRDTVSSMGDYAGAPISRRLNRLEYDNTIRDLTGLTLNFSETFPTEGGGGEGFTNNGETLFLPAILMERYLEAAQQILDSAIITPPYQKTFSPKEFVPVAGKFEDGSLGPNEEALVSISISTSGDYEITLKASTAKYQSLEKTDTELTLKLDGIAAQRFKVNDGGTPGTTALRLQRGVHTLALRSADKSAKVYTVAVNEKQPPLRDTKRAAHQRIFGTQTAAAFAAMPADGRRVEAQSIVSAFARRAFRRPLKDSELERFLSLYQRSADRNETFEESIKLALKAVLVSPHFLFRVEIEHEQPGIHPISQHELASRLSYFLWTSMPDDTLLKLADEGKLNNPEELTRQINRMLDDPRLRAFVEDFTGQWLGTKEVGASVAFTAEKFKGIYTNELAAELREEPIRLMQYVFKENRNLMELIDSDYVFVTARTAKHYGIEGVKGEIRNSNWNDPTAPVGEYHRVAVADGRRGGVLGLGAVHMITSYPNRTSPVLRGAWVLETMLGVRVPPPPPDVPTLESTSKKQKDASLRAALEKHRENPSCAACHNLMDPIGFGLENFDLLGRWRDMDGKLPVDASGVMPSGEKFKGPRELKQVLLNRKSEFARHISGKMLGYATGRSLDDHDDFTIEKLAATLERENFQSRVLIRGIVLSTPFRNRQGGEVPRKNAQPKKKKDLPAAKPL